MDYWWASPITTSYSLPIVKDYWMIPFIASQFSGQFVFFLFPFQFSSVFTDLRSSYTDQWFNCTGVLLSVRTIRIGSTKSTCVHTCISSTHFTSFTSLHSSYFFMIRIMESSRVLRNIVQRMQVRHIWDTTGIRTVPGSGIFCFPCWSPAWLFKVALWLVCFVHYLSWDRRS